MKASVLINGSPSEEFKFERGLRQGDPLSPSLFNILGQVFSAMMKKAESVGLLRGIKVGQNGKTFSHLQFADDTIIFIEPSDESLSNLKRIM